MDINDSQASTVIWKILQNNGHGSPEIGRKINAIKDIRAEFNVGLKEAKDLVDKLWNQPTPVLPPEYPIFLYVKERLGVAVIQAFTPRKSMTETDRAILQWTATMDHAGWEKLREFLVPGLVVVEE